MIGSGMVIRVSLRMMMGEHHPLCHVREPCIHTSLRRFALATLPYSALRQRLVRDGETRPITQTFPIQARHGLNHAKRINLTADRGLNQIDR